ncbi:hypothetical protein Rhopal_003599-T1 [Rhodotorula paludigena]|uniref:Uncharacterized protein n=1 Tax=Rhodotorula paludigena TaxID=86838 RepID=A0AAV5GM87_9BASI|nr:hypothetical protein Rhopal_003599-T1 [Rhodotorula paludigena]
MPRPRSAHSLCRSHLAFGLVSAAALASSAVASPLHVLEKRYTDVGGYANPTAGGGKWLTLARNTWPEGLGEPINIVISANSHPALMTDEGFYDWGMSINFGTYLLDASGVGSYHGECFGQTDGARQAANLGDGNGMHNQSDLLRENFGDVTYGVCKESANGGFHYRVWRQNGTDADTGAWFLAASEEEDLSNNHMIVDNGYDLGRDEVVRRAVAPGGTKSPITNTTYTATAVNASGVGYFDNITFWDINHRISTDGVVMVLTVDVTDPGTLAAAARSTGDNAAPGTGASAADLARAASVGLFAVFALALLL